MSTPIRLVMSADRNYAIPLEIALTSVRHNLPNSYAIDLTLLSLDLSAEAIRWRNRGADDILRVCTPCLPRDIALPVSGHITDAAYFRLCLELAVPADIRRVIYLDSDLLVVGDLSRLWKTDLQGRTVGAVVDFSLRSWNHQALDHLRPRVASTPGLPYFNSGVLLLDMTHWRQRNVMRKAFTFLHAHPDAVRFWDQDALNAVLLDDWHQLDPRWNRPSTYRDYRDRGDLPFSPSEIASLENPFIMHFVSGSKPWTDYRHPDKSVFDRYACLAGFPGFRFTLPKAVLKRTKRWLTERTGGML